MTVIRSDSSLCETMRIFVKMSQQVAKTQFGLNLYLYFSDILSPSDLLYMQSCLSEITTAATNRLVP